MYVHLHVASVLRIFALSRFVYLIPALTAEETDNIPGNITKLNITACRGTHVYENRVVDEKLTWYQALASCKEMGFDTLDDSLPNWVRRLEIKRYLEDINYNNLNYTFWFGAFRPYLHIRKWYNFPGMCKEYSYDSPSGNPNDGFCAVIRRNATEPYNETVAVEDCENPHQYICAKYKGRFDFIAYKGFHMTESLPQVTSENVLNVSFDECKTDCYLDSRCSSFTYFNDSGNCTLFRRAYGYGSLDYTIERLSSGVTHYTKTGCFIDSVMSYSSNMSSLDRSGVPDCEVDEIPPGYCPCEIKTQDENATTVDHIVNEIVKNLTVDRKATSTYKRKFKSSSDDRRLSKAFGVFGILLVIGALCLFVIVDLLLPVSNSKKVKKIRKCKTEKKENQSCQN